MNALLCSMKIYHKLMSHTCDRSTKWDERLDIEIVPMMAMMMLAMKLYFENTGNSFTILGGIAVVVIVYVFLAKGKKNRIRRTLSQSLRPLYSSYSSQVVAFSRVTTGDFFQLPGIALRPLRA